MSAENCAQTVLTHSVVCSLTCVLNIPCKLMSMPDSIDMIHPIVDIEASFFTDTSTMCGSGGKYSFWFLFFLGIVKGLLRSSGEPLSICITPLLLLRSLRACSLGVVLAKVAKNLYMYVEADRKTPPPCFLVKCSFWIWQLEGGRKVLPSVLLTPSPRIDKRRPVC